MIFRLTFNGQLEVIHCFTKKIFLMFEFEDSLIKYLKINVSKILYLKLSMSYRESVSLGFRIT